MLIILVNLNEICDYSKSIVFPCVTQVMAVRKRTVQVIQIATIEASASQQIPLIVATVSTGGQG